jgi:hypothetical protein
MKQYLMAPVTAVLALGLATGCATTVKQHPEFNDRHSKMQKLAVYPPDVKAIEVTFNTGQKPLPALIEALKTASTKTLQEEFKAKGYEIETIAITQDQIDKDPALKEAVYQLSTLYQKAIADMQKNTKKEFTYSVESAANYFTNSNKANAIIMTREVVLQQSSGLWGAQCASRVAAVTTQILFGVSAVNVQSHFQNMVEVAIVDADQGDILWYNLKEVKDDYADPSHAETIPNIIKDVVKPFPNMKGYTPPKETKQAQSPKVETAAVAVKAPVLAPVGKI